MLLACMRSCVAAGVAALVLLLLLGWPVGPAMTTSAAQGAGATIWTVPEIGALPNDASGRLVRRGRDLITATYAHIGPEVADRAKRFAGNNLACGNCHLQAGTKKFGIPLFGLFGVFPRYNARLGAEMTIEERLNACMTRSMNGRALPAGGPEMQALVAYIKFLSTGVGPGQRLPGLGTGNMPELDRAADPVRGEASYTKTCVACHGPNGAGIRRSLPTTDLGYGRTKPASTRTFPIFWKSRSTHPTALTPTASASSSTNTGRSRRSAPRLQSSRRRKRAGHPRRRADHITCAASPRSCPRSWPPRPGRRDFSPHGCRSAR